MLIDLNSESVSYEDLGVDFQQRRRTQMRPPRRRKPGRKRVQKKDRLSKMKREMRNTRSKILNRLDKIKYRRGSPQEIQEARKEARTLFQEYKRNKKMLMRFTAGKKKSK